MADATPHKTLQGHTDVRSVAFSNDNKLIASASDDKIIRFWNVPNGDLNVELKGHTSNIYSVAFSPDGKSIVTGSDDNTVRTWSVATKQQVKTLNGHSDFVNSVAWSPNGDLIASGSNDTTVILWDATSSFLWNAISGSAKKKLTGHTNAVWSVSFSHNGNKLASAGSYDNTAIIWDVRSGAALINLAHPNTVSFVCFSPDAQFVVTGCHDKIVRMFNATTGREEKRFEGHTGPVRSVVFSFDGSMIASGSNDKSVRLWDVASTKQLQQLNGHTEYVHSVLFSRDGKFIASGGFDHTVRLWNAPSSLQRQISPNLVSSEMNNSETGTQHKQAAAKLEKKEKELRAKQQEIEKREQEIADRERKQREELEKQKKQEEAKKIQFNLDPTQVAEWNVDDVCNYFKQAKIDDDVIAVFRKQKIRGISLANTAKDEVLKSMGIDAMGDRQFVIHVINQLVSPNEASSVLSDNFTIPFHEIILGENLGQGHFGLVRKGTYHGEQVAVKVAKVSDDTLYTELLKEARNMKSIPSHDHVVKCIGLSLTVDQAYVVLELCDGSLKSRIDNNQLSDKELRSICLQVAKGMEHLTKHNMMHGDLAARNILFKEVNQAKTYKIADFGRSHRMRLNHEYYIITGKPIPIFLSSPQMLLNDKATLACDVWAFGLLIYELYTRGRDPFYQLKKPSPQNATQEQQMRTFMANVDALKTHICDSTHHPFIAQPAECPDVIYHLMKQCLTFNPAQRITFIGLCQQLEQLQLL